MDFDYDPDEIAYETEEEAEAVVEEELDEIHSDEASDEGMAEDSGFGMKEAAVGAAIFGMAEEYGEDEAKHEFRAEKNMESKEFERPPGAVSLKARKKESNLPPFEQWVKDVITGKKTLDDEL